MSNLISNGYHLTESYLGFFKLETVRESGEITSSTGWFPNLITNTGKDLLGNQSTQVATYARVGTGTATPAVTDTLLQAQGAFGNSIQSTSNVARATPPYYWSRFTTIRIPAGSATGTWTEVGVAPTSTGNVWSRALILDGLGNPTSISVAADEALDVSYELRLFVNNSDQTGSIVISGVTYSTTLRPADITTRIQNGADVVGGPVTSSSIVWAMSGPLGAITGAPSGTAGLSPASKTLQTYSNGSYTRDIVFTWGLTEGNASGGVGALYIYNAVGVWQIGFSPSIPKDATKILTLTFRYSWDRNSSPDVIANLSGSLVTGQRGTLIPGKDKALTGGTSTSAPGTLTPVIS